MRSMLEDETRKFHEELEELKIHHLNSMTKFLANGAQHEAERRIWMVWKLLKVQYHPITLK